jgi:hypothetical protein
VSDARTVLAPDLLTRVLTATVALTTLGLFFLSDELP